MKITITKGCVANGKPQKVGAQIEVTPEDGNLLIGMGRAEKTDDSKKSAPAGK